MKHLKIPAKTFLLGEYAALFGHDAIILTTNPCFEISVVDTPGLHGIHPESPAGKYWQKYGSKTQGLQWFDPYEVIGGLGASSAQFIGAFWALNALNPKQEMLAQYIDVAWSGNGVKPSGYDVLAQAFGGVVYISGCDKQCFDLSWPFLDIDFVLVHTGEKLATHEHLLAQEIHKEAVDGLARIVTRARNAFRNVDSMKLTEAIKDYHLELVKRQWVASFSLDMITRLSQREEVLAAKGCGAMGADIILLIVEKGRVSDISTDLLAENVKVIATSDNLMSAFS